MIEISHLTKKYGGHLAVDDLSLQIAQGKIYGFLGPNGAGKSTTMNIITGYLAATQGTVTIDGFDIFKQPEEAKKCLGYLPEQPPLYMDMTVYEYLKFVADLKKLPRQKRSQYISEAMELTRISDMKKRLIRNLSKGYRQRVGFAQAVLGYPKVIILDEPTVGLDPKQMIEIRELILSLGRQHTVILSSHILSEVREVCEHIFIISKGRLTASDTTENLIARMSGEQELHLLVKGKQDAVVKILSQAHGIASQSVRAASESGCQRAVLRAKQGTDIRADIFYLFAQAGIPILEMTTAGKSLEQVFLELTDQSAAETGNAVTEAESGMTAETENSMAETENSMAETKNSIPEIESSVPETESGTPEVENSRTAEAESRMPGAESSRTAETENSRTAETESGTPGRKQQDSGNRTDTILQEADR